jgi:hypothetical protein
MQKLENKKEWEIPNFPAFLVVETVAGGNLKCKNLLLL